MSRALKKRGRPAPRLLIYGISQEAWTRRYGVEPFTYPCYVCETPQTTSIPFRQGTLVGLQAPACPNGCNDKPDEHGVWTRPPFAMVRDWKYGDLWDRGGDLTR